MGLLNSINRSKLAGLLWINYSPQPDDRAISEGAQTKEQDGLEVTVTLLSPESSRRFFGVPMARRGIQPVWLRIVNRSKTYCRLQLVSIDANYYSAHEAAAVNHYSIGKRLIGLGAIGWLFLPLLLLVPGKLISAWRANRKIDDFFRARAFRLRPISPGGLAQGFVYTPLNVGSRIIRAKLLRIEGPVEFEFNFPAAGIDADYQKRELARPFSTGQLVECDLPALRQRLGTMPPVVTGASGLRSGDPANLVVIGDFVTLLSAFGGRWDETETITLATCWKTFKAFLVGAEYRHSPVSALYLFGRSQDFALQRIRDSINERLHLRLWMTELRYAGRPVWVGQVSRDIGVRFTPRTWNLTTHRIDPDVDEARDYVLEDLLEAERVEQLGYVTGVGPCEQIAPRHNLTGDPYFTDGYRAIAVVSTSRTAARFIEKG